MTSRGSGQRRHGSTSPSGCARMRVPAMPGQLVSRIARRRGQHLAGTSAFEAISTQEKNHERSRKIKQTPQKLLVKRFKKKFAFLNSIVSISLKAHERQVVVGGVQELHGWRHAIDCFEDQMSISMEALAQQPLQGVAQSLHLHLLQRRSSRKKK